MKTKLSIEEVVDEKLPEAVEESLEESLQEALVNTDLFAQMKGTSSLHNV